MDANESASKAANTAFSAVSGIIGGFLVVALTKPFNAPCAPPDVVVGLEPCRNLFGGTPWIVAGSEALPYLLGLIAALVVYGLAYAWRSRSSA